MASRQVRPMHVAFVILAAIFAMCITIQVFLAGLSIFVDPIHWAKHTAFVHMIEFVPLLMLVLSFIGRLPVKLRWQSAALFVLVFVMYFTANFISVSPIVAAFHPVVALALFWLSIRIVPLAWRLSNNQQSSAGRG